MTNRQGATADLVTGAVLFALAMAMVVGAWTMSRLEIRQIHPLTAPGLLPGLLGIALALCSILLIVEALARRRAARAAAAPAADPADSSRANLGIALLLCLGYALGLVGRVPFWLATALFVGAFILVFEWPEARTRRDRLVGAAWAVGIGLVAGVGIALAFSDIFLVRLP